MENNRIGYTKTAAKIYDGIGEKARLLETLNEEGQGTVEVFLDGTIRFTVNKAVRIIPGSKIGRVDFEKGKAPKRGPIISA